MTHEVDPQDAVTKRTLAQKLRQAEKQAREKAIKEREKFRGLQIRPTASFFDDAEYKEPGEDNWSGFGFDIHPHVTFFSVAVLTVFIVLTLMFQETSAELSSNVLGWVSNTFGWFFILASNIPQRCKNCSSRISSTPRLNLKAGFAMAHYSQS